MAVSPLGGGRAVRQWRTYSARHINCPLHHDKAGWARPWITLLTGGVLHCYSIAFPLSIRIGTAMDRAIGPEDGARPTFGPGGLRESIVYYRSVVRRIVACPKQLAGVHL